MSTVILINNCSQWIVLGGLSMQFLQKNEVNLIYSTTILMMLLVFCFALFAAYWKIAAKSVRIVPIRLTKLDVAESESNQTQHTIYMMRFCGM